ncbi:MAG: DUF2589 domain-containing protein [Chloroflexi bacterium]|nr:DUF2589 domain-containing protein [Chloroflexota bacterium]
MLSQGKELTAIDFSHIIGGPLVAVINAQAQAARVTANFLQSVAFEPYQDNQPAKLKTVEFDFQQVVAGLPDSLGDQSKIKVPLITMIPIPFIRVDNMTIDLNVNLHDTNVTKISNDFMFKSEENSSEGGGFLGWGEKCSMQATVSDQNTFQNDQTTDDTYSLKVTVHAVQDQMPAGMSQIIGIFSTVVQQQAALIQTIMTASVQAQTQQIKQGMQSTTNPTTNPTTKP